MKIFNICFRVAVHCHGNKNDSMVEDLVTFVVVVVVIVTAAVLSDLFFSFFAYAVIYSDWNMCVTPIYMVYIYADVFAKCQMGKKSSYDLPEMK